MSRSNAPKRLTTCKKQRHRSEAAALAQLRQLLDRGLARDEARHPYKCLECGFWHIGKGQGKARLGRGKKNKYKGRGDREQGATP